MIYSFEKSDPAKNRFIEELTAGDVDFEVVDHDRSVVRILGSVGDGCGAELDRIYEGRRKLTIAKRESSDLISDFRDPDSITVIAGPCSVESEQQIEAVVSFLTSVGVRYIRGGAYKPRTSASSFQGMGRTGLRIICDCARTAGLKVVSEVMDRSQIDTLLEYADIIQVGSRNMFNYTLTTALGSVDRPVLLKRGMAATVDEWLKAADYISRGGNDSVILCERGIRTFEPRTRNTLDIAAIHIAKEQSGFPVIADPSHAAGNSDLVAPLAMAAAAAGADGIMVEIHPRPEKALSDRNQALRFDQFERLLARLAELRSIR